MIPGPPDRAVTALLSPLAERRPAFRLLLRLTTHAGDGAAHLLVFPLLYRFGAPPLRSALRRLLAATALSLLVLYPIRALFKRRRPIGDLPAEYAMFPKADVWSFPSGHAMRNFLLADLLGRAFPALRRPLLAYAGAIALARVFLRLHWLSDILAGAAIGIAVARATDRLFGVR